MFSINLFLLSKHVSCKCECKFKSRKCNSNQKWNNDECWCEYKNRKEHLVFKKGYIWNPVMCSCENDKYVESIIANSVITCDKNIEETKSTSTKPVPTKTIAAKSTSTVSIFY